MPTRKEKEKKKRLRILYKGSAHKQETIRRSESFSIDRRVTEKYPSARIMVSGTKKFVVRDRNDADPKGVVPWIKISPECYTAGEAWDLAASLWQ